MVVGAVTYRSLAWPEPAAADMTVVAGTVIEQMVEAGMTPDGLVVEAEEVGVRNMVTRHYLAPSRMMRESLDWRRDHVLAGAKMSTSGEIDLEEVAAEGDPRRTLMIVAAVIEREEEPSNSEVAVAHFHTLTVAVAWRWTTKEGEEVEVRVFLWLESRFRSY